MKLNDTRPSTFQFINIVDEWKKTYHIDSRGNIVFQNKMSLANIRFDNHSFHNISKNSTRGVENLPETLANPTELWMRWGDESQTVVIRNYILIGSNFSYLCQTKDGIVTNGFSVINSLLSKYRKGLLLLK